MSDTEAKTNIEEFITRLFRIEQEQKLLNEDKKDLVAEFKDKLDIKTVQAAIRIAKIKAKLDSSEEELENAISVVNKNISV
jgi:uncharacterized protein (UPF0335 family)